MRSSGAQAAAGLILAAASIWADEPPAPGAGEGLFLSRVRQLTFEGQRAGEGYFSSDRRSLVFQSEREPDNPFFQIYEMDLDSGEVRRISSGVGKTTCAFPQPGTGRILFASTHHDPRSTELQTAEFELRASGRQRRYQWDFDAQMDLYVAETDGALRRLTDVRGYDAEGSYSPDGEWIVFASTRVAYEEDLDEEERRQLEADPAVFAEIFSARADGSAVRRLTWAPGYDGGPFFTPDGERIVWRRFRTSGDISDLWSMRADGSDPRQITDFGSMSWAPFPHPSGGYILFTTNKLGFANFELFIVDPRGEKEPVRVTYTEGFDGLPVPAPDGRSLAWTSNRRGGGAQLMLADWNHEAAVDALARAPRRERSAVP